MMIWGDMLLASGEVPDAAHAPDPAEARARRAGLPRDVLVTDWHYGAGERFPGLDLFRKEGLSTVACTWYQPLNVYHFARAAIRNSKVESRTPKPDVPNARRSAPNAHCRGLLQTTWAGYFPDEPVLETELRQFAAFILAAEYAWSGRTEPPAALPYHHGGEFTRAYYGGRDRERKGLLIDLEPAADVDRDDWLGLGPGWDLSGAPSGEARFDDVLFRIPQRTVVLGKRMAPEGSAAALTVKLACKAGRLALLNSTVWGVPNGTIAARMTVEYADGSTSTEQLVAGRTTAHWTSDTPALRAPVGWRGTTPAATPRTLRVTWWDNPHPEREIARVRFEVADAEAGWALAGMTAIE
jgi:hypothetical protein